MVIKTYKKGCGNTCLCKCDYCGKEFERAASYIRKRQKNFCCLEHQRLGRMGHGNPFWKGGRFSDKDGYVRVLAHEHPNSDKNGRVFEHRLIMEKELGRLLTSREVVHHLNGIKDDNRPENLALKTFNSHDTQSYIKQLQARIRELEASIGK